MRETKDYPWKKASNPHLDGVSAQLQCHDSVATFGLRFRHHNHRNVYDSDESQDDV
jgi:hypothetical protein